MDCLRICCMPSIEGMPRFFSRTSKRKEKTMTQSSRREFMKTMAAAAILAQRGGGRGGAASPNGRIDVHHHMIPKFQPGNPREWTPQMSLDTMGKFGIATSILSEV